MASSNPVTIDINPTNTPRVFHVEATWKRQFQRHFNVKYAWCVCREEVMILKLHANILHNMLEERYDFNVGFANPAWALLGFHFFIAFLNTERDLPVESEIEPVHKF